MVVRNEDRSDLPNIDTSPSKPTCNTVTSINDVMSSIHG